MSGLVISRNAADGAEVTHFKIASITGGSLFLNNGTTPISNGAFIRAAQASAGIRFTPAQNSLVTGHFSVQALKSNSNAGLGGGTVVANISITPARIGTAGNDVFVLTYSGAAPTGTVSVTDTFDFTATTTLGMALSISTSAIQVVNTELCLKLGSGLQFENIIGGSKDDILTGNSLANRLTGNAGNDRLTGGAWNDTLTGNALGNRLTGNAGHDILVGNSGDDQLMGGAGCDILIGGLGVDVLNSGADDDILIAGRTTSDALFSNLNDLRTGWISANPYATRIASLRAGVGGSGASLKAKVNVFNNAAAIDTLTGAGGRDWYFRALDDVITDLLAGESLDVL